MAVDGTVVAVVGAVLPVDGTVVVGGAGIWNTTCRDTGGSGAPAGGVTVTVIVTGEPCGGLSGPSASIV